MLCSTVVLCMESMPKTIIIQSSMYIHKLQNNKIIHICDTVAIYMYMDGQCMICVKDLDYCIPTQLIDTTVQLQCNLILVSDQPVCPLVYSDMQAGMQVSVCSYMQAHTYHTFQ